MLELNVMYGAAGAVLAVVIGTKISDVGLRNYLFIMLSAVLTTDAVIEHFFFNLTLLKSTALGWVIGWFADDVIMAVNAMFPAFVRDTVDDIGNGARSWIKRFLNKD